MKKIVRQTYILGIIILLTISPIVSSNSISIKNKNEFPKELANQSSVDTKIVEAIDMVNESMITQYLQDLVANGPRTTGTYGADKAAEYIFQQFKADGLKSRYDHWKSFNDRLLKPRFFESQNIIGTLHNDNETYKETLIFNAHYDSAKVSPGANDDGSGIAAVLAAAYVLSNFEFNRTIRFVAFSGEEQGLLGSKNFAKELYEKNEDILVEFNADMIGYAATESGARNVSLSRTQDAEWIINEIEKVNEEYNINLNVKGGWPMTPGGSRSGSDYHDFILYGYEAVAFWEDEGYPYFHTSEDTVEHVNIGYLVNVTKLIVGSLAHMADVEVTNPRVKIGTPRHGRLYFEDRTLEKFKFDKTMVVNDVLIHAEVRPGDSPIEKVEFYYNGKLIFTDNETPYQFRLNKISLRQHNVKVIAYDESGRNASDEINFNYINLLKKR